jgi:hypothetical protein
MGNRLDNLCFGAVWENLRLIKANPDFTPASTYGIFGTQPLGGLSRGASGKGATLQDLMVRAATALARYTGESRSFGSVSTTQKQSDVLLRTVFPGAYNSYRFENPCGHDIPAVIGFVKVLADPTPDERRDLDAVMSVLPQTFGILNLSFMPPHVWHPNVRNLTYERDRQPFARWRPAVYNTKAAMEVMDSYPWPGSKNEFIRAYREFAGHDLADLISAGADTKGAGRLVPSEEIRTFITFGLLEKYQQIEDRAGALVRKRARKKARQQLTRTIMLGVMSAMVGGIALSALGAGAAGLSKLAIGQLGAKQKRDLEDDLKDTADEFRDGAPAFAAEIDRVVAEIDAQIAPEGAYAVVVEGVKVADAPTLEEATAKAEATAVFGDRFEILFNGKSTGLQVRAGGITIPIPKESEAQVRALTRDQAKAFAQKVTEAATQTVKKEEAALVAAERQPATVATGGSVLVPILALAAAAFALKS